MTANRYKRPSQRRTLADVVQRVDSTEFGNPRSTFRAAITDQFDDITTDRRPYFGDASTDTVFWDYWDDNYNRQFFEPVIQNSGVDTGRVGAVTLLIPGVYNIRATIDWQTAAFNLTGAFNTWIGSNYDDGGLEYIYMDLNSSLIGTWTLDHIRILWPSFTNAEESVEITASHDNDAQEPLYIPGGIAGYWGRAPMLTITYLGGLEGEPEFFQDA